MATNRVVIPFFFGSNRDWKNISIPYYLELIMSYKTVETSLEISREATLGFPNSSFPLDPRSVSTMAIPFILTLIHPFVAFLIDDDFSILRWL